MRRRPWTRCAEGYGTHSHCPRHAATFVREGVTFRFLCSIHGRTRGAVPIRSDARAIQLVEQLDRRRRDGDLPSSRTKRPRLTYRSLEKDPSYEHPVDRTVRLRVGRRDLQRTVVAKTDAIVKALGRRRRLWFEFESAADELRARREAAYFDAGVEQGISAAVVHGTRDASKPVRAVADRIVRETAAAGVSSVEAASASILAAWALLRRHRRPTVEGGRKGGRRALRT